MNAGVLEVISIVAFVLAAIFAVLSVVLFFRLNVRAIVDDLSGKKAERQIRAYREQGAVSRKRVSTVSNQRDYYNPATQRTSNVTERLPVPSATKAKEEEGTMLLAEEGTMLLAEEGTALLSNSQDTSKQSYNIIFDEMIIHTGEEI